MTTASLTDLPSRLYETYAPRHVCNGGGEAAALVYRRDIHTLMAPLTAGFVVDLGCGRGAVVRLLEADGFGAEGIDISPVSECSWCVLRPGRSDDDLARDLATADLFALAMQTRSGRRAVGEGFGLVLLEAQAAGTPVIAPAYGGSREAYVEGVTGVAPADESAEALTRTLHKLLKDPARLAWMAGHAAQWTRQAFAPEHYAQLAVRRLL